MQRLHIIAVGDVREKGLKLTCAEYEKRLGAYAKVGLTEIPEYKLPQNPSPAQIAQCLEKEGERILAAVPQRTLTFALCIEGEMLSSETLAQRIEASKNEYSNLAFLIGGSHGLSDAVKSAADHPISMSRMTFPHQLARVMLLEQLYRACTIGAGSKYHK